MQLCACPRRLGRLLIPHCEHLHDRVPCVHQVATHSSCIIKAERGPLPAVKKVAASRGGSTAIVTAGSSTSQADGSATATAGSAVTSHARGPEKRGAGKQTTKAAVEPSLKEERPSKLQRALVPVIVPERHPEVFSSSRSFSPRGSRLHDAPWKLAGEPTAPPRPGRREVKAVQRFLAGAAPPPGEARRIAEEMPDLTPSEAERVHKGGSSALPSWTMTGSDNLPSPSYRSAMVAQSEGQLVSRSPAADARLEAEAAAAEATEAEEADIQAQVAAAAEAEAAAASAEEEASAMSARAREAAGVKAGRAALESPAVVCKEEEPESLDEVRSVRIAKRELQKGRGDATRQKQKHAADASSPSRPPVSPLPPLKESLLGGWKQGTPVSENHLITAEQDLVAFRGLKDELQQAVQGQGQQCAAVSAQLKRATLELRLKTDFVLQLKLLREKQLEGQKWSEEVAANQQKMDQQREMLRESEQELDESSTGMQENAKQETQLQTSLMQLQREAIDMEAAEAAALAAAEETAAPL